MPKASAVHWCQKLFLLLEQRVPACRHEMVIVDSFSSGLCANSSKTSLLKLLDASEVNFLLSNNAPPCRGPIAPSKPLLPSTFDDGNRK
jgi:hypothetical protein